VKKVESKQNRLLIAVGSRYDRVCSIGAFARAEAKALAKVFDEILVVEPDSLDRYPVVPKGTSPEVVFFHAPALHDRKKPWNALVSAAKLRARFPSALFIPIVHEYSEAPLHWKIRQAAILKMGHGVIVNSEADLRGVRRWHRHILKTNLGPTLFYTELLEAKTDREAADRLNAIRNSARIFAEKEFGLKADQKWLLHPGLFTPGKGIDFLSKLGPHLPENSRFVVMGGKGPKQRDQTFADQVLGNLDRAMSGKLLVIDSPDDLTFQKLLIAADLVVLPYDIGVSERRSSFLASMCCGANVWTTEGEFSMPLAIDQSGAHRVPVSQWRENDDSVFTSLKRALDEDSDTVLHRRIQNLSWARKRTWENRARDIVQFITELRF
jgi:hypothetical protein